MSMILCLVVLAKKEGLDEDLSRFATWTADQELAINKIKYAECLFYSEKTLPLNSRSPSLLVKLLTREIYLLGLLISTLSSQNALNLFYGESFQPVQSLLLLLHDHFPRAA